MPVPPEEPLHLHRHTNQGQVCCDWNAEADQVPHQIEPGELAFGREVKLLLTAHGGELNAVDDAMRVQNYEERVTDPSEPLQLLFDLQLRVVADVHVDL